MTTRRTIAERRWRAPRGVAPAVARSSPRDGGRPPERKAWGCANDANGAGYGRKDRGACAPTDGVRIPATKIIVEINGAYEPRLQRHREARPSARL